jgi:hypothetical protein
MVMSFLISKFLKVIDAHVKIAGYFQGGIRERDDHIGRAVYGMNCLRSLEHWDHGFEFRLKHGCLCAFILSLCVLM